MREKKDSRILYYSNELFLDAGYEAATMRQIAKAAEVSLGLATYHFKSKRLIAVRVMEEYLRYLKRQLRRHIAVRGQPLVHSAAMVRLCIEFFLSHPCKRFYLECLRNDIYMEAIQNLGNEGMESIARVHNVDIPRDLQLLFDDYIPPTVEKILLLEKEKGGFPGIAYEDIPEIVFSISVEKYLNKGEIAVAERQGMRLAREVLAEIPPDITGTLFSASEEPHVESKTSADVIVANGVPFASDIPL